VYTAYTQFQIEHQPFEYFFFGAGQKPSDTAE
jgi:hypothetical protein